MKLQRKNLMLTRLSPVTKLVGFGMASRTSHYLMHDVGQNYINIFTIPGMTLVNCV